MVRGVAEPGQGEGGGELTGHRWRWGWRIALYAALLVILTLTLQAVAVLLDPSSLGTLTLAAAGAACAGALLASWVMMSAVESRPPASLGLAISPRAVRDWIGGSVLGFALVFVVVAVMAAASWVRISSPGAGESAASGSLVYVTAVLVLAAFFEEVAIRGYAFQVLARARGPAVAIGVTALVFAALHGANPGVGRVALANTLLAGILLGILYWKTWSLWYVTGVHFAWNWTMGVGIGLPVSGLELGAPLIVGTATGPPLLTGGEYGPEAGLLLASVTLLGIVWTVRTPRLSRDPAVLAMAPIIDGCLRDGTGWRPGGRGLARRRIESEEA